MRLDQATPEQLHEWENSLSQQYQAFKEAGLNLDITRGKPSADQLSLSNTLDGILEGNYTDAAGTDLRNYGGLDGIPEAKALFAGMIDAMPEELIIGGNSSLTLMYFSAQTALYQGLDGADSAWNKENGTIKFIAPVPGYDRHFTVCEHLGIELIPVPMTDDGPNMDEVERLIKSDPLIKGIWCVPRFSNPTGIVYSDEVTSRIAKLGKIAGKNFRVFWDNAYAAHIIENNAPKLANILEHCRQEGTEDSVLVFGSTSKITFAGAGVAFMAASTNNRTAITKALSFTSIGPDKINQMRHVRFLKNSETLAAHMEQHAKILKPRFDAVLTRLKAELGDGDVATWTEPKGGYFISLDTQPGLAQKIVELAGQVGVKLTPAGATFPYGKDPEDRNIRIAPSFPTIADLEQATDVFIVCLKLASVRQQLSA